MKVATGDVIIGDADGLAIIPRNALASVLERLDAQRRKERALDDGANGPNVTLPARILEAVRAFPVVEREEAP